MSWFDDLVDTGKSLIGGAVDFFTGNSVGANIAKTALLGFAVNRVSNSIQKDNTPTPNTAPAVDPGVRLQSDANTQNKIPVLYGNATMGGIQTDAVLSNNQTTMYFCYTFAEKTGTLLSTSAASTYVFNDVFFNDNRVIFNNDGITAAYMIDREGNQDVSIASLVKIYCYAGSSTSPQVPEYYTNASLSPAYSIMPGWTSAHTMDNLLFAIVEMTYNKDKNVNRVPTLKFSITNSMSLPGDCIYDYMTNARYGCDIPATDILTA